MGSDLALYRASIGNFYLRTYSTFKVHTLPRYHSKFLGLLHSICLNNLTILAYIYFQLIVSNDVALNPGPPKTFSFCTINCRSILSHSSKMDHLAVLASHHEFTVIALTETWLNPNVDNDVLSLDGYSIIRNDRSSNGGGVALYIRENLVYNRLDELDCNITEAIWVKVHLNNAHVIFGVVYCPQTISEVAPVSDDLMEYLNLCMDTTSELRASSSIITGDFNAHVRAWGFSENDNALGRRLKPFINNNNLTQLINEPTCGGSLLDLIITDKQDLVLEAGTLPKLTSHCDHQVIWANFNLNTNPKQAYFKEFLNVSNVNWDNLNDSLLFQDWDAFLDPEDPTTSLNDWILAFETLIKTHIPIKRIRIKPRDKPWINNYVKHLVNVRHRKYKKARKSNNPTHWEDFRLANENCKLGILSANDQYHNTTNNSLNDPNLSPKAFWKIVKTIHGKQESGVPDLVDGDHIVTDTREKCELINSFLARQCDVDNGDAAVPVDIHDSPPFVFNQISVDEVYKLLLKCNKSKAPGPDMITNTILSSIARTISPGLTTFFNFSINNGVFPKKWKTSNVVPIFKNKGEKSDVKNYRPISLLNCISKVFERLVANQINNHLKTNNLIYNQQAGFQQDDSTINQLIVFTDKILQAMEEGKEARAVFLDMSRAFDRVWHDGLLFKLQCFGINGYMLKWFSSYLSDRSQRVVLNGITSSPLPIKAGVPQGSILGPILFLIYANDITQDLQSDPFLFADDTTLLDIFDNSYQSDLLLNSDLLKIQIWAKQWLVDFNPTKTVSMTFSTKLHPSPPAELIFFDSPLNQVETHKHLGITFHSKMQWRHHVDNITRSCLKRINILRSIKYRYPRDTLATIYCSTIRPILEYGCAVFYEEGSELAKDLERIQYQAGLQITGALRNTSYSKILNELGWQSLAVRIQFLRSTLLYKAINGHISPTFSTYINQRLSRTAIDYNLRHRPNILAPPHRSQRYNRSFIPSSTNHWNTLPIELQSSASVNVFKIKYKNIYFTNQRIRSYGQGTRRLNVLHSRFRLGFSSLNNDLFKRSILPSDICSCRQSPETYHHYFLECTLYTHHRTILLGSIRRLIDSSNVNIDFDTATNDLILDMLINGFKAPYLSLNIDLFQAVQGYISGTKRFPDPPLH